MTDAAQDSKPETRFVYYAMRGIFCISPRVLLRLWEIGTPEIGTPVERVFVGPNRAWSSHLHEESLLEWRDYKKVMDETPPRQPVDYHKMDFRVFSPDEKYVLSFDVFNALGDEAIPRHDPRLHQAICDFGLRASEYPHRIGRREVPVGSIYKVTYINAVYGEMVRTKSSSDWVVVR